MKQKTILRFILFLMVLCLCSCDISGGDDTTEKYKITYSGGEGAIGTVPTSTEVEKDTNITLPLNPFIKEGYSFTGWNDGDKVYLENAKYTVTKNVTFTATWQEVEKYTVTYAGGEGATGTTPTSVKVEKDTVITLPVNPFTKEGYLFTGWSDGDKVYIENAKYIVTKDVTFTATWQEVEKYTVTYSGGEGSVGTNPTSVKVEKDTVITLPVNPFTKESYLFTGWSDGENLYSENSDYTVTKDVTFTATWQEVEKYTVTYVGGEGATGTTPTSVKVEKDTEITLPVNPFTKEGYLFTGWSDGDKVYIENAKYIVTKDVTFTATWQEVEKYTVTYSGGEGSVGTNPTSVKVEKDTVITLPVNPFTKESYLFTGWSDGENLYSENSDYTVTKDVTFTATWQEVVKYTVTYAGGEGSVGTPPTSVKVEKDTEITLPVNPFTKEGYLFIGWSDGENLYIENAKYIVTKNVTFTATWQEVEKYTVTYFGGEGSVGTNPTSVKVEKDTEITLPVNPFTKEGYLFTGWSDGEKVYLENAKYIVTKDVTFTATWQEVVKYTVTYAGGEGSVGTPPTSVEVEKDTEITLPVNPFTKEGYLFIGWSDGEKVYIENAKYIVTKNVTFTATWQEVEKYTVTYAGGEGSVGTPPTSVEVEKDTEITLPVNPFTKEGYLFTGWSDGENLYLEDDKYTVTKDVTFTAEWQELEKVTISFNSNEGNAIDPLTVYKGSKLEFSTIPEVSKDGYIFVDWYLDEDLLNVFDCVSYVFNENTVLYAKYQEILQTITNTTLQEETSLFKQALDKSFIVLGNEELTDDNLNEIITITTESSDFLIPSLSVSKLQEGIYQITPTSSYTEGGSYTIVIESPFAFEVEIDSEKFQFKRINFRIESTEKDVIVTKDSIVSVKVTDYYVLYDNLIYLHKEFVLDKSLYAPMILAIDTDEGTTKYTKIVSLSNYQLFHQGLNKYVDCVIVEMEACELTDVYQDLDVYQEKEIGDTEIELNDQEKLVKELRANPDMKRFIELSTFAISDYINHNKLSVVNNITIPVPDISIKMKKDGNGGVTADIDTSFRIKIDDNIYADVIVNATEYVHINTTADGKVKSNLSWYFTIEATVRAVTNLKFEVILYHNGQKYDIKEKINEEINHPKVDSFVADYKKNLAMDTDEIELFSVRLFRAKLVLAYIFEIGIPVDFNLSFDLNAAFSSDILYSVTKTYGIKGSSNNGIESYTKDVLTTYDYSFYYGGCIGFKAGISLGLEVGVAGFSYLGVAGIAVEVGAYFDFYGYGSYQVIDRSSIDNINAYIKTTGGYAYEFGIYLDIEVYAESSAFFVKADKDLFSKKFTLLNGGDSTIAIDYQDSVHDNHVIMQGNEMNYLSLDLFSLVYMDLKTGKTVKGEGDIGKFLIFFNDPAFYCNTERGIIGIKEYYLRSHRPDIGGRIDTQMIIKYWGPNISTTTGYLEIVIPFSYIPLDLDIPIEDINKTFTATFKIKDEVYTTDEILIGTIPVAPKVNKSWYDQNPSVGLVIWNNITEPIMEDTDYQATVKYRPVVVEFEYYLSQGENEPVGTYVEKVYCFAEDLPLELVKTLEYFDPNNTISFKFIGWSENINEPVSYIYDYTKPVRYIAKYEKVPFEVVLDVAPVINNVGEQIYGRQIYKTTAYYGELPNIEYETIPGYTIRFRSSSGGTYSEMRRVYSTTTIQAELVPNKLYIVEVLTSINGITLAVLYQVPYGANVSYILKEEAVVNYEPVYDRPLPVNLENRFVGWFPDPSVLEFVTSNITIIPMFELVDIRYHYSFDPGIGSIPSHMRFLETDGIDVSRGEELLPAFVAGITPTVPSTDTIDYIFTNWYEKDEQGNLTVFDFNNPPQRDVQLVAQYTTSERLYNFELIADGDVFKKVDGVYQNVKVDASFSDGSEIYWVENLNFAQKNEYISKLRARAADIPVPDLGDDLLHEFYYWRIVEYADKIKCYAYYKAKPIDTPVEIILNVGLGKYDNDSNIITINTEVTNEHTVTYYPSLLPFPLLNVKVSNYDENGENFHELNCAYLDDDYYYLPSAWSYDGVTPLAMDHEIILSAVDNSVSLYLIYEQIPRFQTIDFEIKLGKEKYTDGLGGAYRRFIRVHGTSFTEDMIPGVISPLHELDYYYENIFIGWMNQTTGEIGVTDIFDTERVIYVPVFEKRLKEIKVTFNAGDNGIFLSTGTNKKEYIVAAGSIINDAEIPVYTSDSQYYNYYFDRWDFSFPYITGYHDEQLYAKTKKIRNQNPTEEIGIIASKDGISEDISISSLRGYEYDIDENRLIVFDSGYTFTGVNQQKPINLELYIDELTLCNLNLICLSVNPAGCDLTKINIDGTVNIITDTDDPFNTYSIFSFTNHFIIKGLNETSKFKILYKTAVEKVDDYPILLVFATSITVEDIDFTIELDIPTILPVHVFRIEYSHKLSLIRSKLKIEVLGEMNNNVYAINLQEEAVFIKDSESQFEVINCIEEYQD